MKKVISILLMLMCISLGATAAVKCKAVTQKGTQCTRVAKKDGYCTQHYNMHHSGKSTNGVQCKATTQEGNRCSRRAVNGGYCTQHFNSIKKDQNNPGYDEKAKVCFDDNGRPKKAENDAERCNAATKKGTQCKLKAIPGTNYCPTHTK